MKKINLGDNIKVVVGLDFRTTYSGFSYCHTAEPKNIITNNQWPDIKTKHNSEEPCLPKELYYQKASTDYLREIGEVTSKLYTYLLLNFCYLLLN